MIQASEQRNRADVAHWLQPKTGNISSFARSLAKRLASAAVLLYLLIPAAAQETDAWTAPAGPEAADASRIEARIEQAFAPISELEIALKLNEPALATIPLVAMRPVEFTFDDSAELVTASVQAAPRAKPQAVVADAVPTPAPAPEPPDAASVFALALSGEEQASEQEPLGGGYMAALAPVEQDVDLLPDIEAENSAEALIPLPDAPGLIPMPTPRPEYAPVARVAPEVEAAPRRVEKEEEGTESAPPRPRASRPAERRATPSRASRQQAAPIPAAAAPRPAQQTSRRSEPMLPSSLLPTRPPAN